MVQEIHDLLFVFQFIDRMDQIAEVSSHLHELVISLLSRPIEQLIDKKILAIIDHNGLHLCIFHCIDDP